MNAEIEAFCEKHILPRDTRYNLMLAIEEILEILQARSPRRPARSRRHVLGENGRPRGHVRAQRRMAQSAGERSARRFRPEDRPAASPRRSIIMWLRARAGWRSGSRRSNVRFPSRLQSRISSPGKHGNEQRGIRLHHRRRRLRRLRARQSPDRLGPAPRAAARSGRRRPLDMDPHPGGHRPHPHRRARDLALPHRARREGQRPADLLAARARARRLERRERHDLGARRSARVRQLGEPRQSRLGHHRACCRI